MKYWTNDMGLKARVGYCPYHPELELDDWGECEACKEMIMERVYAQNKNNKKGKHEIILP